MTKANLAFNSFNLHQYTIYFGSRLKPKSPRGQKIWSPHLHDRQPPPASAPARSCPRWLACCFWAIFVAEEIHKCRCVCVCVCVVCFWRMTLLESLQSWCQKAQTNMTTTTTTTTTTNNAINNKEDSLFTGFRTCVTSWSRSGLSLANTLAEWLGFCYLFVKRTVWNSSKYMSLSIYQAHHQGLQ